MFLKVLQCLFYTSSGWIHGVVDVPENTAVFILYQQWLDPWSDCTAAQELSEPGLVCGKFAVTARITEIEDSITLTKTQTTKV